MKYNIINCEEAKRITGWDKDMNHEYRGPISGYYCGYNFEVKKGNITDFASCTFLLFLRRIS